MDDSDARHARRLAPYRCRVKGTFIVLGLALVGTAKASAPASFEQPPQLRACCAFGTNLKVDLGPLSTPVVLTSIADPESLGPHRYGKRGIFDERNGLIYTCRGGFIDLGHLRAAADWTAHLHFRLQQSQDYNFETPDGPAHIQLKEPLQAQDAANLAAQLAYQLTVVHELATFSGVSTVGFFSEAFSAFSPEDLYSDLLGVHIAQKALASTLPWDEAVNQETQLWLHLLEARSPQQTRQALMQVSGKWWNPDAKIPSADLLKRRNFAFGPRLAPWTVPQPELLGCGTSTTVVLQVPNTRTSSAPEAQLEVFTTTGTVTPADFASIIDGYKHQQAPPAERSLMVGMDAQHPAPEVNVFGIHVLPLRLFAGLTGHREATAGMTVWGGWAKTPGGDLKAVQLSVLRDPEQGLITHVVGLSAERLFFCRSATDGSWVSPISSWFVPCEPGGLLGVGADLLTIRYDGRAGRLSVRPLAVSVSVDLLQTAFTKAWASKQLGFELQAAVETDQAGAGNAEALFWGEATVFARLGTDDATWMSQLELTGHQEAVNFGRRAATLRLTAEHIVRSGALRWTLGLEGGTSVRQNDAQPILQNTLPIVFSDSWGGYGLLSIGVGVEELVF